MRQVMNLSKAQRKEYRKSQERRVKSSHGGGIGFTLYPQYLGVDVQDASVFIPEQSPGHDDGFQFHTGVSCYATKDTRQS